MIEESQFTPPYIYSGLYRDERSVSRRFVAINRANRIAVIRLLRERARLTEQTRQMASILSQAIERETLRQKSWIQQQAEEMHHVADFQSMVAKYDEFVYKTKPG